MQIGLVSALLAAATIVSTFVSAAPLQSSTGVGKATVDSVNFNISMLKRKDADKTYKGTATWYKPKSEGGDRGACGGKKIDNDSKIVALNHKQYGNMDKDSDWCGKKIRITGPKGTAEATIMDACPECKNGDLDLTPALFKKVVGKMKIGEAKITWELV